MNRSGVRALLLVPAVLALAAGAVVAVQSSASAQASVFQAALALDDQEVQHCVGGAQRRAFVDIKDVPEVIGENAGFVQLTDASITFNGPANGTDQVILIFTGEADLFGQPNVLNAVVDSLQVQLLMDGVVLAPGAVMFTTDAGESNALQACVLVGPGMHTATVEWWLSDIGANNALTGTMASWEFHLEQNE
jgi:hypothetical protein